MGSTLFFACRKMLLTTTKKRRRKRKKENFIIIIRGENWLFLRAQKHGKNRKSLFFVSYKNQAATFIGTFFRLKITYHFLYVEVFMEGGQQVTSVRFVLPTPT
jgi:hypothetical protein